MEFLSAEQLRAIVPEAYDIVKTENIKCIDSTAAVLTHKKTGARVAVFINEDENKLFSALMKSVEGVEELFLCLFLTGNELNVVNEKNVEVSKTVSEKVGRTGMYSLDKT